MRTVPLGRTALALHWCWARARLTRRLSDVINVDGVRRGFARLLIKYAFVHVSDRSVMRIAAALSYFKLRKEEIYAGTHPRNRYFQFLYSRVWG